VVATPEGFEGLRAIPGRDLLIAKTPEAIAQSIIDVLDNRHPNLASAARKAVEDNHQWIRTLRGLDDIFSPKCNERRPALKSASRTPLHTLRD
jgi:hypothetical protein